MMLTAIGVVHRILLLRVINNGWKTHGTIWWRWWWWWFVNGCRCSIWLLIPRGRGRNCVDFLLVFIIPLIGKVLLCGATYPTGGLIEELLIIFYHLDFETVFYVFFGLDQVGKWCASVKPVIVSQRQSGHKMVTFSFPKGRQYLGSSQVPL